MKTNLQEEQKQKKNKTANRVSYQKDQKSFIAEAQASSTAFVSSYYPSVRSSATSLEEEVILSLLGLPSDMHKSSSGMNL